ncbi:MAG: hypothetical protein E6855_12655 [Staphylococcus epidermidis]|nr:hypothetical protein [Staphylococcus epidermidis]
MNKHIKITLGDFIDFQAKHDLDDANLLDMIAPVDTMVSKEVKGIPGDCSLIAGNSVL